MHEVSTSKNLEIFKKNELIPEPSEINPRPSKSLLDTDYASQKLPRSCLIAFEEIRNFMKNVTFRVHAPDLSLSTDFSKTHSWT